MHSAAAFFNRLLLWCKSGRAFAPFALYMDRRLDIFYPQYGAFARKDEHIVNAFKRCKHFRPFAGRNNGPQVAFILFYRSVGIDAENKKIPKLAGGLQIPCMPHMNNIETTIRRDHFLSIFSGGRSNLDRFLDRYDLLF